MFLSELGGVGWLCVGVGVGRLCIFLRVRLVLAVVRGSSGALVSLFGSNGLLFVSQLM